MNNKSLCTDDSFEIVYKKYKDTIFRVAFNYTNNISDAQDIMQDVFIKYIKCDKEFVNSEHLKAWFIRVTINMAKNIISCSWNKKTVKLEENISFENAEESNLFYAVRELPEKYRIVVYLYYYEDYSIKEISSIIKVRESAIQNRLMRARSKLKNILKEAWKDD